MMGNVPFPADVELIGNLSDRHIPDGTADRLGDDFRAQFSTVQHSASRLLT
jgi:hypothetical protein